MTGACVCDSDVRTCKHHFQVLSPQSLISLHCEPSSSFPSCGSQIHIDVLSRGRTGGDNSSQTTWRFALRVCTLTLMALLWAVHSSHTEEGSWTCALGLGREAGPQVLIQVRKEGRE